MAFDYMTATPDEIRAEVARRARARKGWTGEEEPTPEQQSRKRMLREKEVQTQVIRVYKSAGCKVRATSQPRKAKYITPGGADLQIFSPQMAGEFHEPTTITRKMWYHETKTVDGKYSDDQLEFAADCRDAGIVCLGGGPEVAREHLRKLEIRERE